MDGAWGDLVLMDQGRGAMLVFVENSDKVIQECNYQEKIAL
jgi:hypothetical protein